MDVVIHRTGVAHPADRLAYANQIASFQILSMGVQYFVRKAVRIPYGYSSESTLPRICCHDAGYRRTQLGIPAIDPRLPDGIVEIDAAVRD